MPFSPHPKRSVLGDAFGDDALLTILDEAVLRPIAADPAAQVRRFFEFISPEQAEAIYPDVIAPAAKKWLAGFRTGPDWISHKGLVEHLALALSSHDVARRGFFRMVALHYGVPSACLTAGREADPEKLEAFSEWALARLEKEKGDAAFLPVYAGLCVFNAFETKAGEALLHILALRLLDDAKAIEVLSLEDKSAPPLAAILADWFRKKGVEAAEAQAAPLDVEAHSALESGEKSAALASAPVCGAIEPTAYATLCELMRIWRSTPVSEENRCARSEAAIAFLSKTWAAASNEDDFSRASALNEIASCMLLHDRAADAVEAFLRRCEAGLASGVALTNVFELDSAELHALCGPREVAENLFTQLLFALSPDVPPVHKYNAVLEAIPRKNRRTGASWLRGCMKAVLGFLEGKTVSWAVRQTKLPISDLRALFGTNFDDLLWYEALSGGVESFEHLLMLERYHRLLDAESFTALMRLPRHLRTPPFLTRLFDTAVRLALCTNVLAANPPPHTDEVELLRSLINPPEPFVGPAQTFATRVFGHYLRLFESIEPKNAAADKAPDEAETAGEVPEAAQTPERTQKNEQSAKAEEAVEAAPVEASEPAAAVEPLQAAADDSPTVQAPVPVPETDDAHEAAQAPASSDSEAPAADAEELSLTGDALAQLEAIALPPGALAPFETASIPDMPYGAGTHRWFGCVRLQGGFANFYPLAELSVSGKLRTISQDEAKHLFPNWGGFHLFNAMEHAGRSLMTLADGLFLVITVDDVDLEPNIRYGTTTVRNDYEKRVNFPALCRRGAVVLPDVFGIYPVVRAVSAQSSPEAVVYVDDAEKLELRNQRITFAMPGQPVTDDALESTLKRPVVLEVRALTAGGLGQKIFFPMKPERVLLGPLPLLEDAKKRLYVNLEQAADHWLVRAWRVDPAGAGALCTFSVPGTPTTLPARTFAVLAGREPAVHDLMRADTLMSSLAALLDSLRAKGGGELASAAPALMLLQKALASRDGLATPGMSELDENRSIRREITAIRLRRLLDALQGAESASREADLTAALLSSIVQRLLVNPAKTQAAASKALACELAKAPVVERILSNSPAYEAMKARAQKHAADVRAELAKAEHERDVVKAETERLAQARDALAREAESLEAQAEGCRTQLRELAQAVKSKTAQAFASSGASPAAGETTAHGAWFVDVQAPAPIDLGEAANLAAPSETVESDEPAEVPQGRAAFCAKARSLAAAAPPCGLKERKLADYLVTSVQGQRSAYKRNFILSLFINLTQNFLTVFSGSPGSGKTSTANILARTLGLTSVSGKLEAARSESAELERLWPDALAADRYLPVSVERGWSSKRDFVGYWNPLQRRFESPDARRYDCFRLLDAEARLGIDALPFVILLDEANLSPMEYYFADFLNLCDERDAFSGITLGDRAQYVVPDTLRFLATINNDHTTEILSPRLLDRAAVVTLPDPDLTGFEAEGEAASVVAGGVRLIGWPAMRALFGPKPLKDEHRKVLREIFVDLYGAFAEAGISVSPRVKRGIERYASAACGVMTSADGRTGVRWAADLAVAERLLPKAAGSGSAFEAWLEVLGSKLEAHQLARSAELVAGMLERGRRAMGYYKFF